MGPESRGGYNPEDFRMNPEKKEDEKIPTVPVREIRYSFSPMGSKGGQNANKVSSGAELHWTIGESGGFSDEQKESIRKYMSENRASYYTQDDEIHIRGNEYRDQPRNKAAVTDRLNGFVVEALTPEEERLATKVPRREKEKRLNDKQANKKRKDERRGGRDGY